jgi:hypothetical protein
MVRHRSCTRMLSLTNSMFSHFTSGQEFVQYVSFFCGSMHKEMPCLRNLGNCCFSAVKIQEDTLSSDLQGDVIYASSSFRHVTTTEVPFHVRVRLRHGSLTIAARCPHHRPSAVFFLMKQEGSVHLPLLFSPPLAAAQSNGEADELLGFLLVLPRKIIKTRI